MPPSRHSGFLDSLALQISNSCLSLLPCLLVAAALPQGRTCFSLPITQSYIATRLHSFAHQNWPRSKWGWLQHISKGAPTSQSLPCPWGERLSFASVNLLLAKGGVRSLAWPSPGVYPGPTAPSQHTSTASIS